jgi:hypothetical protein
MTIPSISVKALVEANDPLAGQQAENSQMEGPQLLSIGLGFSKNLATPQEEPE